MLFKDRFAAGQELGKRLDEFRDANPVVLALPRGGVPAAFEVAQAIHAPLDVIVVRKLGIPFQPELAMGAVGEGGIVSRNDQVIHMANISREQFEEARVREAEVVRTLSKIANQVICLHTPENFFAVGEWYEDFSAVTDEEVVHLLSKSDK